MSQTRLLEWSPFAIEDRAQIFAYLAAESPTSAILVDDRITRQIELLLNTPEIGRPGRIDGTRELVIQRTPYLVAYRLTGSAIHILRIVNGAQMWPVHIE